MYYYVNANNLVYLSFTILQNEKKASPSGSNSIYSKVVVDINLNKEDIFYAKMQEILNYW